ncbi:MAG: leucine-rich repeat protein [Candidatus Methanomethylophilaceae archaeon]|nr:leucine-rich repeat protein [Candidatus Methanomethylophilaceae archaeon]
MEYMSMVSANSRGTKKKSKALIIAALAVSLALVALFMASGDSDAVKTGSCGSNAYYVLDEHGALTVVGTGEVGPIEGVDKGLIKSVTTAGGITSIKRSAFENCHSLEQADIPGVVSIGDFAFSGCSSLTVVGMPAVESIQSRAFLGCESLCTLDLVNVKTIGLKAFANCVSLSELETGDCLKRVGDYSFFGCNMLSLIDLSASKETVSVGKYAFSKCSNVSSICFPESMVLGTSALGPMKFNIGGKSVMASPSNLAGKDFAGSKSVLHQYCGPAVGTRFSDSGLVYEVTSAYPAEVSLVGYDFDVRRLFVPDSVDLEGTTFDVTAVGPKAFLGCRALMTADLGGVKVIGMKAFANCSDLETVTMASVESVGPYAFFASSKVAILDLPCVETIGGHAFRGLSGLRLACFSEFLTKVGANAFSISFCIGGSGIPPTAENLRGRTFAMADGVLDQAKGFDPEEVVNMDYGVGFELKSTVTRAIDSGFESHRLTFKTEEYTGDRLVMSISLDEGDRSTIANITRVDDETYVAAVEGWELSYTAKYVVSQSKWCMTEDVFNSSQYYFDCDDNIPFRLAEVIINSFNLATSGAYRVDIDKLFSETSDAADMYVAMLRAMFPLDAKSIALGEDGQRYKVVFMVGESVIKTNDDLVVYSTDGRVMKEKSQEVGDKTVRGVGYSIGTEASGRYMFLDYGMGLALSCLLKDLEPYYTLTVDSLKLP